MFAILKKIVDHLGFFCGWAIPLMALITTSVVVMRYGFGEGAIFAQELVLYLHSAVFLLGAAATLSSNGHVRVDIIYRHLSEHTQDWINTIGHVLFTLPFCMVILVTSNNLVIRSWQILEVSPEPGGIPAVFLLKTLIPTMGVLLAMQGFAEIFKCLDRLTRNSTDG